MMVLRGCRLDSLKRSRVDGKLVAFLLFRTHHSGNCLCKADPWSPAELPCRLRGVAPRIANVCGTSERIIAFNVLLPGQSNFGKRGRHKFIQPVGYTRSNNKVLGPIMLKHHPHRFYIIRRPAPVAMYRNVAELEALATSIGDSRCGSGDFPRYEVVRPERRLMVEQKS
jgi:hypothetical protein